MRIPYGASYGTSVAGSALKRVECDSCGCEYVYQLQRTGAGEGLSLLWMQEEKAQKEAASAAEKDLKRELKKAIDLVPCPGCGWYQKKMVRAAKPTPMGIAISRSAAGA